MTTNELVQLLPDDRVRCKKTKLVYIVRQCFYLCVRVIRADGYSIVGYGKSDSEYEAVESAFAEWGNECCAKRDEDGLRAAYSDYQDAQAAQWALAHVNDADPASFGIVDDE